MGQKINPNGFRVGINKSWDSCWFANKKDFSKYLLEDYKIREIIESKHKDKGINKILIDRQQGKCIVSISTAKPGLLIGQKGVGIEQIKKDLSKISNNIIVNIIEVKQSDLDAVLVAQNIAAQLEKRASFRRTMKQALSRVMKSGAKGVKLMVGGRLDGAEIARSEFYIEGSIPLQTIRADIDFGIATAHTTFGTIGVKVWIYKGEILNKNTNLLGRQKIDNAKMENLKKKPFKHEPLDSKNDNNNQVDNTKGKENK